ncbi:MAG: hypothetical protein KIT72_13735 [Polyangiaceae bacterium]|nr:hypothetical protein [Polyangiaceae bacterium]MCW5791472.1 hypothetical protein [Polyangiaceae bacterium]
MRAKYFLLVLALPLVSLATSAAAAREGGASEGAREEKKGKAKEGKDGNGKAKEDKPKEKVTVASLEARRARLVTARSKLRKLADQPMPKGLKGKEAKLYAELTELIRGVANGCYDLIKTFDAAIKDGRQPKLDAAQAAFNMQYLQLQQSMQDENRKFTTLSNIMKTRHDTAKNAISNVK